jgi:[NiFe] hydrogenase diaphorase moiety large subunit
MDKRKAEIHAILRKFKHQSHRLMDIVWACQTANGTISQSDLRILAKGLGVSIPHLLEVISFYHFFRIDSPAKHLIYLDSSIVAHHAGMPRIRAAFERELKIPTGQVSADGLVGLFETPCIGMSDQSPAALVDFVPITRLTEDRVREVCRDLTAGRTMVANVDDHLREVGLFIDWTPKPLEPGSRAARLAPQEIINEIVSSGLRGCGGAGFGTGKKWDVCRGYSSARKYVVCNADEGEPGTFKDRVLLTRLPETLLEGMAVAGKCIGASEGIIYLRAEYRYLLPTISNAIKKFRPSFHRMTFRIQLGAGAYVCGEESALLESLEGKRGEPRIKPPFPVEKGYLGFPTVVNNVETFILAAQILRSGAAKFHAFGTSQSPGVKLLSVSGDVDRPGIYEIPWGTTVSDILQRSGARNPSMIQVGGPSGHCISIADGKRTISFEDLPTGGSFMVFGDERDKFEILTNYMDFFVAEPCGNCTPCRAGNVILRDLLRKFRDSHARHEDLARITQWAQIVAKGSRCGLGASSPNVLTSSLQAFPDLYRDAIPAGSSDKFRHFDLARATADYDKITGEAVDGRTKS